MNLKIMKAKFGSTYLPALLSMLTLIVALKVSQAQSDETLGGQQINVAENIETAVVAEPLNQTINTKSLEFGATLTKDGRRLYFSRQGYLGNVGGVEDEDIWVSEFDDITQTWKEAKNIGYPLNGFIRDTIAETNLLTMFGGRQ